MKRQIGPVTCVHSYGQLDAHRRGRRRRLLKISRTLHTLTKMNGNQTTWEGRSKGSNEASEKSPDCQTRLT